MSPHGQGVALLGDLQSFPSYAELARTVLERERCGRFGRGPAGSAVAEGPAIDVVARLSRNGRELSVRGDLTPVLGPSRPTFATVTVHGEAYPGCSRHATVDLAIIGRVNLVWRPRATGRPSGGPDQRPIRRVLRIHHVVVTTTTVPLAWVTGAELEQASPDPLIPDAGDLVEDLNRRRPDIVDRLAGSAPSRGARVVSIDRYGVTLALARPQVTILRRAFPAPIVPTTPRSALDAVEQLVSCSSDW